MLSMVAPLVIVLEKLFWNDGKHAQPTYTLPKAVTPLKSSLTLTMHKKHDHV